MTVNKVTHSECMWAELKPDCYGGEMCDEVIPGWSCHTDGDMDGEDNVACLELAAKHFAPGTKIIVSEPCCPDCNLPRWPNTFGEEVSFPTKCECGFDWNQWVLNEYS